MLDYIIGSLIALKISTHLRIFAIKRRARKSYSDVIKGAEPFLNKAGSVGVLMIHGFSSTPDEMKELGDYLKKKNITNYCPLLPGHGTSPEKLMLVRWDDWLNSIKNEIHILNQICDSIFIVGSSFGGNLAFLAENALSKEKINKKIKGIVSLGAPFSFPNERIGKIIFPLFRQFKIFQKKQYPKNMDKEILGVRYYEIPVLSIKEILKIVYKSKKILPSIKKPTLLIQSKNDHVVTSSSIKYIQKNIGSEDVRTMWLDNSYHVVLIDKKKDKVFKEISKFINLHKM